MSSPRSARTTASGQGHHLQETDLDQGAAIIPIDAQPRGISGFGRAAARDDREDSDPPPLAGPAAGRGSCRALIRVGIGTE